MLARYYSTTVVAVVSRALLWPFYHSSRLILGASFFPLQALFCAIPGSSLSCRIRFLRPCASSFTTRAVLYVLCLCMCAAAVVRKSQAPAPQSARTAIRLFGVKNDRGQFRNCRPFGANGRLDPSALPHTAVLCCAKESDALQLAARGCDAFDVLRLAPSSQPEPSRMLAALAYSALRAGRTHSHTRRTGIPARTVQAFDRPFAGAIDPPVPFASSRPHRRFSRVHPSAGGGARCVCAQADAPSYIGFCLPRSP